MAGHWDVNILRVKITIGLLFITTKAAECLIQHRNVGARRLIDPGVPDVRYRIDTTLKGDNFPSTMSEEGILFTINGFAP